ncbi:PREDICTED: uncharacterized protein LOC106297332 [Brassica oleracea var. oleracea]|uniref:uncharacterized protein LOC106297332 n=1 Tax=Brassica oleracea var. oleracea TaxID=109376 RepID=UPI0006A6FF73|nr:PREDICTED: uncharacterized protein LOC106297332 [Brassica oleracea var. oleracea]
MADTNTVDDYAGKLSGLASRAAALGEIMKTSKMVKKFLKELPRTKFIHIVASLEQVLDLNSTGFKDIVGRLKAFEERVKDETQDEDQSKLMFVKNDTQGRGSHNNSRGRSRGRGHGGRGRGRGRSNSSDGHNKGGEASDKTKKDYSKVKFWRCDKMGHFMSHCPTRPREEANLTETQEADALYIHEVVFLNEERVFAKRFDECDGNTSIWYLDNGASNHMTGKREFFSNLDESIKGKVKFGDGSNVEIVGKDSITFFGKTGERRTLKDI